MENTIQFTQLMMMLAAGIGALLQGFKAVVWTSKVKPFFPLLAVALGIGGCYLTKQTNPAVAGLMVGMAASFGFDILKGINAKKIVASVILCLLLLNVGCVPMPVRMAPGLGMAVEMAAISTAEFDKRCKAGDPNACAMGLDLSNETLQLIVDGLHGEIPE